MNLDTIIAHHLRHGRIDEAERLTYITNDPRNAVILEALRAGGDWDYDKRMARYEIKELRIEIELLKDNLAEVMAREESV